MNKISSKYWYICVTLIISVGLLNSGCFQIKKPSFLKRESNDKDDRINALEEKLALQCAKKPAPRKLEDRRDKNQLRLFKV